MSSIEKVKRLQQTREMKTVAIREAFRNIVTLDSSLSGYNRSIPKQNRMQANAESGSSSQLGHFWDTYAKTDRHGQPVLNKDAALNYAQSSIGLGLTAPGLIMSTPEMSTALHKKLRAIKKNKLG